LQDPDGTNCAGTNVADDYADEVATVSLTSPQIPIPAGGATLTFRQHIDTDAPNDFGTLRLLDATDTEIIEGAFPVASIHGVEAGWTDESYTLPPSAAGQSVKLVFELTTNADGTVYKGFYIDDVKVVGNKAAPTRSTPSAATACTGSPAFRDIPAVRQPGHRAKPNRNSNRLPRRRVLPRLAISVI
jgi:hypothetical protein